MKKLYFVLIGLLLFGSAKAQIINFPDAAFKARLLASDVNTGTVTNFAGNFFHLDVNGNGQIEVSEALLVKEMDVAGQNGSNMYTNMAGIEYFTNMTSLRCGLGNIISNLDVSALPQLKILECLSMPITSLDLTNLVNLEKLNCDGCTQLTNLIVNPNNIINDLNRDSNNLSYLNLSLYPHLKSLSCNYNQLTFLDLSSFTNLERLACSHNNLTSLNITGLILKTLNCGYNSQLPLINFSQFPNLEYLDCSSNTLQTSLNLSNCTNLTILGCNNLQLTSLDVSNSPNIYWLNCSNNLLTTLELNHLVNLVNLYCPNNQLTTLFVKGYNNSMSFFGGANFENNPNLHYICCDDSQINYFQNLINYYGYTNCFANSYCSFTPVGSYYVVEGNEKLDSNENGCDALDISVPNLKFNINDTFINTTTIANLSGSYSLPLGIGNYTITPVLENPNYFSILPTSFNVQFPSASSPFLQDFCVSVNGVHPDLEILFWNNNSAIPGGNAEYTIIYRNKGNQIESGAVRLSFDDTVSNVINSVPIYSNLSTNLLTWNFTNLQPFETRLIHLTLQLNSPTQTPPLNSGSILNYTAVIDGGNDETPNDNSMTYNQTIWNSFDPNNKICLEGETIAPLKVGDFAHYIINFENDGTANAHNIVVKDIIDTAKYDITTLVPIKGSAPFTTRITNTNQVAFIFQNINLPFVAGSNQGYVAFKIKTKPTLVLGDTFSNTASIYFDYNAPIVTNTATTTIAALVKPEFVFSDYFTISPIPTKGILNINTKQDITISSISIYNTLGQVVLVTSNPSTTIDVSNLTTGSYFIKVITDKGTSSGKFIKE